MQKYKVSFKGQNIYVGIDVHLKTWHVTTLTESGCKYSFSQHADAKELFDRLNKKFPEAHFKSAYEAGFCSFSAHYALTEQGIENIVVHAAANTPYFQEKSGIYYIYSKYTKTKEAEGDGRITLEACDDAATANWGGTWRMTTESEMNDLLNHTTKTFYYGDNKYNGANGVLLTGNSVYYTDKSIFFPYVGSRSGSSLSNVGTTGSFWLSTLDTNNSNHSLGRRFFINSSQTQISNQSRQNGYPIRPMKP